MAKGLSEFDIISQFFAQPFADTSAQNGIQLGIGDDAAVLNVDTPSIVMATDTLNEGVHFPRDAPAAAIASRALYCNLSDMAAMGAQPWAFTLALTLPDNNPQWLQAFSQSLAEHAKANALQLVGGDTTRGPLAISLTLLGKVTKHGVLSRNAAKPGDDIYHSGHLGSSACALHALLAKKSNQHWHDCFYQPPARWQFAMRLAAFSRCAIDISDGLLADLGHILTSSECAARLDENALAISQSVQEYCAQQDLSATTMALTGGEDFELCFTAPVAQRDNIQQLAQQFSLSLSRIGEIFPYREGSSRISGVSHQHLKPGFLHF